MAFSDIQPEVIGSSNDWATECEEDWTPVSQIYQRSSRPMARPLSSMPEPVSDNLWTPNPLQFAESPVSVMTTASNDTATSIKSSTDDDWLIDIYDSDQDLHSLQPVCSISH